jgi:hypothetical protein
MVKTLSIRPAKRPGQAYGPPAHTQKTPGQVAQGNAAAVPRPLKPGAHHLCWDCGFELQPNVGLISLYPTSSLGICGQCGAPGPVGELAEFGLRVGDD